MNVCKVASRIRLPAMLGDFGWVGWGSCLGGALVSSAPTEIGWYTITWLVHDYLVGALLFMWVRGGCVKTIEL